MRWLAPSPIGVAFHRCGFTLDRGAGVEEFATGEAAQWFDDRGEATTAFDHDQLTAALEACGGHAPVHVLLPNPAVRFLTLATEQRVRKRTDMDHLLRWHAERLGMPFRQVRFDYAWTGSSHGKHHLFAIAADHQLLETVCAAAKGRYVRRIVPAVAWLLAAVRGAGEGQLLIDVDQDAWCVLLLDGAGHVRAARADWRLGAEVESVASEARRLVNMMGDGQGPVRISSWCPEQEWAALRDAVLRLFPTARDPANLALSTGAGRARLAALL